MKKFPTLYKKTSTGALQEWTIEVDGTTITTRFGQTGGKIQLATDVIKEGKNIGRSNETTAAQQAELEAQALWEKQLRKDYVKTKEAAMAGEASELVEGGILPMLAKRYDEDGEKIIWPAYSQPKLDGIRCISIIDGKGKCTLWSRTRKPIVSMPHIIKAVEAMGEKNLVLDGELYADSHKDKFEQLTSLIRPEYAKEGHEVVEYHVYDIADNSQSFSQRSSKIKTLGLCKPLVEVATILVENEDELMVAFESFRKQGYEGAIVRNTDGFYVNKRSFDLQKVKEFMDSEFLVTDVVEGRGKLAGHGIFVCQTKSGTQFEAKMVGALDELKKYYENPKLAVGKMLTVQYQGLTNKNGVPRFPVALRFRQDV